MGDWFVLVWIRGLVARWDTYYQQGFIIDWLEVGSIILLRLGAPYKQICGIKVGCRGTGLVSWRTFYIGIDILRHYGMPPFGWLIEMMNFFGMVLGMGNILLMQVI